MNEEINERKNWKQTNDNGLNNLGKYKPYSNNEYTEPVIQTSGGGGSQTDMTIQVSGVFRGETNDWTVNLNEGIYQGIWKFPSLLLFYFILFYFDANE